MISFKKNKSEPGANPFPKGNDIPWYSPRPWHGMTFSVWLRELSRNQIAVSRLPMAGAVSCLSLVNSYFRWLSESLYGANAEALDIEKDPIFLLGHWRTGTTFLHELIVEDTQFSYPTSYQCMSPHHFLWSERVIPALSGALLPKRRMMDNMDFKWDLPQEDEFALCNLGLPSPYLFWGFPKLREECIRALTLEELSEEDRQAWMDGLYWFFKRLNYADPRQLMIKSPPHTARVRLILKLFPRAKFVHLVRDPVAIIPSTVRTWRQMGKACEMYASREKKLEEMAYTNFTNMYRAFWRDERLLRSDQICHVRYEDLTSNPIQELQRIYRSLNIDGFDSAKRNFENHLAQKKGYRKNRFDLKSAFRDRILSNCKEYSQRYGYATEASPVPAGSQVLHANKVG